MDPTEALISRALVLLAEWPLALDELTRRLDTEGLLGHLREDGVPEEELVEAVVEELLDTDSTWATPHDEMVGSTAALLDGIVLTHRLTAEELGDEVVAMVPDLEILDWDLPDGLELAGGGRVEDVSFDEFTSALAGPSGWLSAFVAGDCVAFSRRGGQLFVEKVEALGDGQRELDALRRYLDDRLPENCGDEATPILLDALIADPGAFRSAVPPVTELFDALGLDRRGFSFGRRGEAWKSVVEQFRDRERAAVAREWRFDECCRRAFGLVNAAFDAAGPDGTDVARPGEVAAALLHGAVAPAFAEHEVDDRVFADRRVAGFAETVVAGSRQTAGARLVAAAAADAIGDVTVAEAHLREAVRADPEYSPAALALAEYETDRGNLERAIALLRHPELSSTPTLELLLEEQDRRAAPFRGVGRNDPCPCGSGRKFKVCCQRRAAPPLPERLSLFQHKLNAFATVHHHAQIVGIASAACDPDDPDLADRIVELCDGPVIRDFAIWEGGLAAEYLDRRGSLLPSDERDLLVALLDEPRRLWELVEVNAGVGMTLRDTRTGDQRRVRDVAGSRGRSPGEYLLARVADLPGGAELIGMPLEIPLNLRASALDLVDHDPDADALAEWYGRATALPQLRNRENEPLTLCRAELRVLDGSELETAGLDAAFERGEPGTWTELWTLPDGERIVRGTLYLEGGALIVEANSVERFERLLDAVGEAVPGAVVVDEQRTAPEVALANARRNHAMTDDHGPLGGPAETPPPELVEALAEYIRERERAWVDESIPALGGLTPRQALDDPTRREDLEALLRDMDRHQAEGPGRGFDSGRIRSLLSLDSGGAGS